MCIGDFQPEGLRAAARIGVIAVVLVLRIPALEDAAVAQSHSFLTVCDLVENAAKFNNATVEIRARVQSGGEHGEYLADKSCIQAAIHVSIDDTRYEKPDVSHLRRKVHEHDADSSIEPLRQAVWATVIGTFRADPEQFYATELQITSARDIAVREAPPLYPPLKPRAHPNPEN